MGSRGKSTRIYYGSGDKSICIAKVEECTLMSPQSSTTYYLPAIELTPTQIHDMGTNALKALRYVYCHIDVVASCCTCCCCCYCYGHHRHAMSISEADGASIHPRMQSSNIIYQSTMANEVEGRASPNWDGCMALSSLLVLRNTSRCGCACGC